MGCFPNRKTGKRQSPGLRRVHGAAACRYHRYRRQLTKRGVHTRQTDGSGEMLIVSDIGLLLAGIYWLSLTESLPQQCKPTAFVRTCTGTYLAHSTSIW